ncbi:lipoprotein [Streptomyces sp. NPDC047072]|uniref:lipoprotein n=1 Tax=Streptomyces sp. NPDC047072 TaxID=3154809 RepID=UPI0033D7EEE7
MLVGAGSRRRRMAEVALLAGVLAGCSGGAEEESKTSTASSAADQKVAQSGGSIGAAGSACELPVTFDLAKKWTAESVDTPLPQGLVSLACEIDAKPAGNIGYLRIWTGKPDGTDARTVLESFLRDEDGVSKEKYSDFKTGGLSGVEVEYLYESELLDEKKTEHALAVVTPAGPVVVHLGGLDSEEHEEMLPAYRLAKSTLRTA